MTNNMLERMAKYNHLVERYHNLDDTIDALLMSHGGHTQNMAESDMVRYRALARERDEVFNAMRAMEQDMFAED